MGPWIRWPKFFQRNFEVKKIVPQKIAVLNLPGAGGTIGTRRLKDSPPDGYTMAIWHKGIITSQLMGVVDYNHESFEMLGITPTLQVGLGVKDDSPIKNIQELIDLSQGEAEKY